SELDAVLDQISTTHGEAADAHSCRDSDWSKMEDLVAELDRILGPSPRSQSWVDLRRHVAFAQACDLRDIKTHDWPAVKHHLATFTLDDADPLPVGVGDLG